MNTRNNEWDVNSSSQSNSRMMSTYPNLYDMIVSGQYKTLLAPGIIPDNIKIENGKVYFPTLWRSKTNMVEMRYTWFIPFAPNGDVVDDYSNGSFIEVYPKYTLLVISSRTPHYSAIEEPAIYDMTSNSYIEVAYSPKTGNTVKLTSDIYKSSKGEGFDMRLEPMSHALTNIQRTIYNKIKNGELNLHALSNDN